MKGIGTFKDIRKWNSGIMFIDGEDGVTYFSHRLNLANKNDWDKYCYNGNKCTFDIIDEGKEHLVAINVRPFEVADPRTAEKKANAKTQKANQIANEERKAKNIARAEELKKRADAKRAYIDAHYKYVIQERVDKAWTNIEPITMFKDLEEAKTFIHELKGEDANRKLRIKGYLVSEIGGKYYFKEKDEWK